VLIVIPLSFSSGALSIDAKSANSVPFTSANTFVIAAVKVVFPCQRDQLYQYSSVAWYA